MGRQDDFLVDGVSSVEVGVSARKTDTVNYITDLLGELHSIANISGLNRLSEDIKTIMAKHTA